jgi:catalase-peroxidase
MSEDLYEDHDCSSGNLKWTVTTVDLVFGSNSRLIVITEVYALDDGEKMFVEDFVTAWIKVMKLDRFWSILILRGKPRPDGRVFICDSRSS